MNVLRRPYRILDKDLIPQHAPLLVQDRDCGAIATFIGTVRGTNKDREVSHLEYEVQEPMALKQFAKMEEKLREEHGIYHLAIDHRKGIVPVGGISVVIAVSAPHRKAALAACAEAIEILKADVPIWKKEVYPDGHEWRQGS
ncbi:MAG: molybdopterin synthase catalytic subunit [Planctomycetota bacterium]|jgi:molybdopterin synthase catalytic subunit